jgi:hypothetical protein
MYTSVVMGEVVVFATDKPISVVCVAAGQVYIVAGDVPTFLLKFDLKVFAMIYPSAIDKATAVPAGSKGGSFAAL